MDLCYISVGRTDVRIEDVFIAFDAMGISVNEIQDYMKVQCIIFVSCTKIETLLKYSLHTVFIIM